MRLIQGNNTNMFVEFEEIFREIANEPRIDETLMMHQYLLFEFTRRYTVRNQKGLCASMQMGSGKTHTYAAIGGAALLDGYKIFVFIHKTQNEFVKKIMNETVRRFGGDGLDKLEKRLARDIKYISLTSTKTYRDAMIGDVARRLTEQEMTDKMHRLLSHDASLRDIRKIKNRMFIIDECHVFFSLVANKSEVAHMFYRFLDRLDISNRIYFFTGTIIKDNPFELHTLNVLVAHNLREPAAPRFPTSMVEFSNAFIDRFGNLKNKDVLQRRIYGLVYYVGPRRETMNTPRLLETQIDFCNMSSIEFIAYMNTRIDEIKISQEKSEKIKNARETDEENVNYGREISATITTGSRILCASGVQAKYDRAVELIKSTYGVAIVYITFPRTVGPKIAASFEKAGITHAFITGDTTFDERDSIRELANSDNNRRGGMLKAVILSSVGETGLNFFNVTLSILFSPTSKIPQKEQVEHCGVRPGALQHLPPEKRIVESHLFIAAVPDGITDEKWEEYIYINGKLSAEHRGTVEHRGYQRSVENHNINKAFIDAVHEASINCDNLELDCYKCEPNSLPLFSDNVMTDISVPSTCVRQQRMTLKGQSIVIGETKYYYVVGEDGEINIYEFMPLSGLSAPLDEGNTEVRGIIEKKVRDDNK